MTTEGLVIEIVLEQNDVEIIKHRVQLNNHSCLDYPNDQFLTDFYERSKDVDNDGLIIERFKNLKPANIIERYLLAYKGGGFILNRFRRFIPSKIWRKIIESYSSKDIMRNVFTLKSDRANEDVYYMWLKLSKDDNGKD